MFGSKLSAFAVFALSAASSASAQGQSVLAFDTGVSAERMELFNVPLSNGTAELPGFGTLKVRSITIGRGTQNYTCASSTAADKPAAMGAVATLYDGAAFISADMDLNAGNSLLRLLPDLLFPETRAALDDVLPIAGQHYFNADRRPVFDMRPTGKGLLVGKGAANISAPATGSLKGEFGVIPWLKLDPVDGTDGIQVGYRTVTAGGSPPATCEGRESTFEVQYAAQYFFYN